MLLQERKRTEIQISTVLIAGICGCALLTGILPQRILSLAVVALMVLLALTSELYLLFPIMIFYYASFSTVFGISVYRLFSLAFVTITWISNRDHLRIQPVYLLLVFIYAVYAIAVVGEHNLRLGIFGLVDVLCAVTLTEILRADKEALKRFFIVYVVIALCSFVTGMITGNNVVARGVFANEYVQMARFQATFEDPNYMGFFFTIAIFAIVTLELFSHKARLLLVCILYAMILMSLSITAVLVNTALWSIYLFADKQMNARTLVQIAMVILIAIGLYTYGRELRDTSTLGALSYRIEEKISNLSSGDINEFTSKRFTLSQGHLDFFLDQPIHKMLFGGNLVTSSIILLEGIPSYSAHNEYIDQLLNVGILGACILIGFAFVRSWQLFKAYRMYGKREDLCMFICKSTWLIYMTSLTVFMDFKYMFVYFL